MYPRDSEIKALNLKPDQLESYMRSQRVHQNNVELMSGFMPLYIVSSLINPDQSKWAGLVVLLGRQAYALGYYRSSNSRMFGGWFHFGEWYALYLVGKFAYDAIQGA
jgi:hypothetical protein